jgi:hypothetical protein
MSHTLDHLDDLTRSIDSSTSDGTITATPGTFRQLDGLAATWELTSSFAYVNTSFDAEYAALFEHIREAAQLLQSAGSYLASARPMRVEHYDRGIADVTAARQELDAAMILLGPG